MNILSADPIWNDVNQARFKLRYFDMLKHTGFGGVRINMSAFSHMNAEFTLDEGWIKTLKLMVDQAVSAGLMVVIDEHDFQFCSISASECRPRILSFWHQVAGLFKDSPSSVMFELLNEPGGSITPDIWNDWIGLLMRDIRITNPNRIIIIGGAIGNSIKGLETLQLPKYDGNIIVTFHYYSPHIFTHQGASFTTPSLKSVTGIHWGTPSDRAALRLDFSKVATWSKIHGRPILLGEFGVYDKADLSDRVNWTGFVAREAEANKFAWAYWQFDSDFVAYDINNDRWVSAIRDALIRY